jgi:hypothetical protein
MRVSVKVAGSGNVLAHWGGRIGSFASPHGLWVDAHGDVSSPK